MFENIGQDIDKIFDIFNHNPLDMQIAALKTILLIYLTVWLMIKAYTIMAGKSSEPIKNLIWNFTFKAAVIYIVFDASWISAISDAINGFSEWAGGGENLYKELDKIYIKALNLGNTLVKQDDSYFHLEGTIAYILVLTGYGILSLPAVMIIIFNSFILKLLIVISPLMIFSLTFETYKDIFFNWLRLLIANILTILFVGLTFKVIVTQYDINITAFDKIAGDADFMGTGFRVLMASIVLAGLVLMARGIAQALAGASIEALPSSTVRGAGRDIASTKRGINNTRKAAKETTGAVKTKTKQISAAVLRSIRKKSQER